MTRDNKVPDILLEQLAAGDLPEPKAQQVRQRLEQEPGGLDRLAALARSNREILEEYPARSMAAAIRERSEMDRAPRRNKRWPALPALTSAAAALFVLVAVFALWPVIQGPQGNGADPDGIGGERPKGDDRIFIHLNTPDGARELFDGDRVKAGDIIQLSYLAVKAGYGVILSVDGSGNATLHFPENPKASTKLSTGGVTLLPFAYELDDAPGFEKFFFITGDGELDPAQLLTVVKAPGADAAEKPKLPSNLKQVELTLLKDSRSH